MLTKEDPSWFLEASNSHPDILEWGFPVKILRVFVEFFRIILYKEPFFLFWVLVIRQLSLKP